MEKANMLLLTRGATEKDHSLKSQILVATAQNETATEPIWQKGRIRAHRIKALVPS